MGINYAIDKFRSELIDFINGTQLPISVVRLVLNEIMASVSRVEIDAIKKESIEYMKEKVNNKDSNEEEEK